MSNGIDSTKHESVYNNNLNKISSDHKFKNALIFIQNFANQNALQLIGRYGHKPNEWKDLFLLPNNANFTRRNIYEKYTNGCEGLKTESISFALWNELWDLHYPNIQTFLDRNEPCFQCRKYQQSLTSTNQNEQTKLDKIKSYFVHLDSIRSELKYYETIIDKCTKIYSDYCQTTKLEENFKEYFQPTLSAMHYTIGWYSLINLPIDSTNPKIYFKNAYKVALFGITIEPLRKFVLYIIPEFVCNKRSNIINLTISLIHHFFSTYYFGEHESFIHFANDQLKNNQLLLYLIWRTLFGHQSRFNISILPPGHGHCWNDLFFGLIKQRLNNFKINSLEDIRSIIDGLIKDPEMKTVDNKTNLINVHLVADDSQQIFIPIYDWKMKFVFVKNLQSISPYNHFEIDIKLPGIIQCRNNTFDSPDSYRLFSNENLYIISKEVPSILKIEPLSIDRLSYLCNAVVPFISSNVSKKRKNHSVENESNKKSKETNNNNSNLVNSKCSYCKKPGHRETIFGYVQCPLKKNHTSIYSNTSSKNDNNQQSHQRTKIFSSGIVNNINSFDDTDQTNQLYDFLQTIMAFVELNERE